MSDHFPTDRLEALRLMILELRKGNFAHRLSIQNYADRMREFEILMNLLAEDLEDFFVPPNAFKERNISDPLIFVMDSSFKICALNKRFAAHLGYPEDELLGQPISKIMKKEVQDQLQQQIKQHLQSHTPKASIKTLLSFHSPQPPWFRMLGYCHWIWDGENPNFFFRCLPIAYPDENLKKPTALESNTSRASLQLPADIENIQKVHQFILENLHCQLPALKCIARKFCLNEFKLKIGFKEVYQTTIFKFHLQQRLELTLIKIKSTPTSLKVIATHHGFKSPAHFSRAFKKQFGKSPSYFKKYRE